MRNTLLTLGQMVGAHARLRPADLGARDLDRALTFRDWNRRSCQLANALAGIGLGKGDRVAVLAYNCLEWAEIYVATAKAGMIAVPINFRLSAPEIAFIIQDSGAGAVFAQDALFGLVEEARDGLAVPARNFIHFGGDRTPSGWQGYEALLDRASDREPGIAVAPEDPWTLMYTSGTTGNPKG